MKFRFFLLLVVVCFKYVLCGTIYSDERLKTNLGNVNTSYLLHVIRGIELREFDYVFEQFYNPIFGMRQLGFIAQDLGKAYPRAVGYVARKRVNHNTTFQNLQVINSDRLYISNIGATQELATRAEDLWEKYVSLRDEVDDIMFNEIATLDAQVERIFWELSDLNTRYYESENKTKYFREGYKGKQEAIWEKFNALDHFNYNTSHKILTMDIGHKSDIDLLDSGLNKKMDGIRAEIERQVWESLETANQAKHKLEATDRQVSELSTVSGDLRHQSDKLTSQLSLQDIAVNSLQRSIKKNYDDINLNREKLDLHEMRVDTLDVELAKTNEEVNKQAGQEIVERRKIKEAEVALEQKKIELEKVRAEEARATEKYKVEMELKKQEELINKTLAREREREKIREETEIRIMQAQHETTVKEKKVANELEIELMKEKNVFELEKIEAEKGTKVEQARIEAEQETLRERENHEVRVNLSILEAEQNRQSTISSIRTMAEETRKSVSMMVNNPAEVAKVLGFGVAFVFMVYLSREANILIRKKIELTLGKPSLIRETSRRTELQKFYDAFANIFVAAKFALFWPYYVVARKSMTFKDQHTLTLEKMRNMTVDDSLNDVVLRPNIKNQIVRISVSTRFAQSRGSTFRHIMLYGPPGTGKTMVAKRMALWCGLDYAIMSGADVAPLKEQAVTEIHNLFTWAGSRTKLSIFRKLYFLPQIISFVVNVWYWITGKIRVPSRKEKVVSKGLLLFIDEADAFLGSRESSNQSESMRNALTALLYHTSGNNELGKGKSKANRFAKLQKGGLKNSTHNVMLVLATNRPDDLDVAVLDRVDEAVEFDNPDYAGRVRLLQLYYSLYIHPSYYRKLPDTFAREVATVLPGFSGRQIAKLMVTYQSHLYANDEIDEEELYQRESRRFVYEKQLIRAENPSVFRRVLAKSKVMNLHKVPDPLKEVELDISDRAKKVLLEVIEQAKRHAQKVGSKKEGEKSYLERKYDEERHSQSPPTAGLR